MINSLKVPVPFEFAFPYGALALSVAPLQDFAKRGQADDQARDKDTGERIWSLTLLDLDPNAARFGRDRVRIKVIAPVLPVLPVPAVPGYPPAIELVGLVLVPYVDSTKCGRSAGDCRARLAYSMRAEGVVAASVALPGDGR